MNDERYYDRRADGSYVIHFPNKNGLSMEKINEMFAEFGDVLSVDDRGKAYGLCYVRYKNLDDTKRCIDGFRNHEFISILPHKNKPKAATKNRMPCNGSKNLFQPHITRGSLEDVFTGKNLYDKQSRDNENDKCKKNRHSDFNMSRLSIKDKYNVSNDSTDSEHFSETHSPKSYLKARQESRFTSNTSISSEITNETSKGLRDVVDPKKIAGIVLVDQTHRLYKELASTPIRIVTAHEIIVGNIHPSVGIHYILHLFEKHNPLSISDMKATVELGTRYCFVYFTARDEAIATQREFDSYSIHGSKLIVSTFTKLLQETQ